MGIKNLAKQALVGQQNKKYEKQMKDKQISYDAWIRERESKREGGVLDGDSASLDADSTPGLVYLISSKGRLAEGTLRVCSRYFAEHPECQIAYGDEDVQALGEKRTEPWFKPDWSPDLFECFPYFGSVVVLREELWERAQKLGANAYLKQGQNAPETPALQGLKTCKTYYVGEGAEEWIKFERWLYISVCLSGAYVQGRQAVGHIPEILFHCTDGKEQQKFLQIGEAGKQRMEADIRDFRDGYVIKEDLSDAIEKKRQPVVSIVIPSKDHPDILENCLNGCKTARTQGLFCEVLIVDNGSSEENRHRVEALAASLAEPGFSIRYLYQPMEFHFSRMCNLGAAQAEGIFLLFLNDDVELCLPDSILRMAALADRDFTGAVGMKLYYPDTRKIQHAGVTNLPMGPVHKLQFLEDNECYYYGANQGWRNVLAVTAACLMVERDKFQDTGGFTEELAVAFNDVDLCFSLYEQGYHNVCINDFYAFHHESLSRGDDETSEKLQRLLGERDVLYVRHPKLKGVDPYYPWGLGREGLDTRIRPAYETAGNACQNAKGNWERLELAEYRRDACLLVRVEQSREGIVSGYGVVLGDDNACYEKKLLLVPAEESVAVSAIKIEGQYRPDLVENMPDQENVGLCGFWVKIETEEHGKNELPAGKYYIGMAAKNRVTGLKLFNVSNRTVEIRG